MNDFLKETIVKWSKAHDAAEDNPQKMLKDPSTAMSDHCAQLMKEIHDAEEELLLSIGLAVEYPLEFRRYVNAMMDSGCASCWVSSRIGKNHPECQTKIGEYFAAREGLLVLGRQLAQETDLAKQVSPGV